MMGRDNEHCGCLIIGQWVYVSTDARMYHVSSLTMATKPGYG